MKPSGGDARGEDLGIVQRGGEKPAVDRASEMGDGGGLVCTRLGAESSSTGGAVGPAASFFCQQYSQQQTDGWKNLCSVEVI